MSDDNEREEIGHVRFDPDGTCNLFFTGKMWQLSRADTRRLINMLESEKTGPIEATA